MTPREIDTSSLGPFDADGDPALRDYDHTDPADARAAVADLNRRDGRRAEIEESLYDYLTTEQAAAELGVKPATWRQWVVRGHVPPPGLRVNARLSMWHRDVVERVYRERAGTAR